MANQSQLDILIRDRANAWNQWRDKNPNVRPDLSGIKLSSTSFPEANLKQTDLKGAHLMGCDLFGANLSEADLRGACFQNVHLVEGNLKYADLRKAHLIYSDLSGADFTKANLCEGDLSDSDLRMTKFIRANLQKMNLNRTDLWKSNMHQANMKGADLRFCRLVECDLTGAILTEVKLYGTARDEWVIKDVKCDYVYWDEHGRQRSPKDRDLESGEFERLYAALPTIEYIFENGMSPIDPLIMDRVVQAIREKRPEFDLKVDSINARGLAPSVKFTVQYDEHKEPALEAIQKEYEVKISRLETDRDRLYDLLGRAIDKAGDVKLITAGPGAIVATDGSTINILQHIYNALDLQKAIVAEPEKSESFAKVAKKTALEMIGEAIKDIAKGQVKEAAKQIIELGKDLGPLFIRMAPVAYEFFINIGG